MCGLAGFLTFSQQFSKDDLRKMSGCIAHRGPDSEGFFYNTTCGLGHRRLSILDLSEAANQPFFSANGRYVMVYNGEVYNYQEIAAKLNVPLKTTSDTEVILEAFAKWGPQFVHELNGMFAIAIYDQEKDELFLFRDRMGIKPVFFYQDRTGFAFASELKALTKIKYLQGRLSLNKEAISQFLYVGYIARPNTIYNEIRKMDSGCYLVVNKQGMRSEVYWRLEDQVKPELITDFKTAKEQLKDLVLSSVKYRMISDVPFGTFLSGGIDSSVVTAAAQFNSAKPVKTFTIDFKEAKHSEARHAREVARYLGTEHYEFMVTQKEVVEWAGQIPDIYDEPYSDSSAIPTLLVSEMARRHVTMTLSGDGGDESFMGYSMYTWADRLENPFLKTFRRPIGTLLAKLGNRYERASFLFNYPDESKKRSNTFSQEQYMFTEAEIAHLLTPDFRQAPSIRELWDVKARKLSVMEQQAFFDLKQYLQDDLLVKIDRASMRHSLETRVPLLDYRIVSFALNLSPELKRHKGVSKYLLKEVLYDFVPQEYFNRPKWGFNIPLANWLKTDLRFLIEENLNEKVVKRFGIVKYEVVAELQKQFFGGRDFLFNRIWLLIILHKWLLQNEGNFSGSNPG
ncbi:asparagine synthase (glutamine-hydrolyzing) [Adhaeribacter soli]|uniref:asparagine synthase (glutamine-hydrolyzing) n=1 Tax=Adhaeribacter soli TaxID=2607655 RepID=A0A5N1ILN9_9BACT|nr:asparagine synthase (glutamine-hydrolyzing) [Adhaeribacter soli]KAA9327387.1 asparagine synthase (glutamine-hydrolyzing) [Adhaeribacter soli]